MSTDAKTVRDWLKALGVLCADNQPERQASAKLAAYAPLLAIEFPAKAFTPASLRAIAAKCKFFPAYAELVELLGEWQRENQPARPAITDQREPDAWMAKIEREKAQAQADWSDPIKVRQSLAGIGLDHPMRDYLGRMLGSLVAKHAPENLGLVPPAWHPTEEHAA